MKLNHINIPVENVKETAFFFETFFDFKCTDTKGDDLLKVLTGSDDFIFVLMSTSFNKDNVNNFPTAFHLGFLLNTKDEVLLQYNKLKDNNITIANEPSNMRGVFGFYFHAPGNILMEVSCKL